jgi:mono/diheme cytochrome c family protein
MSGHKAEKKPTPPQAFGWMAEFDDENAMLDAARQVRDAGYTRTDVFAPFPVHGIDEALGIKPTRLPWFTLAAGLTGTAVAYSMQVWMNGIDYPYIISGKPYISLPAFTPVAFELTVLFAAFTTVFVMFGRNGLPRFSNPVFTNPKFDRASDDRFFLWVDSRDKYFNSDKVQALLQATGPLSLEEVVEDDSPSEVPKGIYGTIAFLILLTVIPMALVWNIRSVRSGSPRWHVFFDMDFQPYRKAQKETTLFADGRTERPPVPGTVHRGGYASDDPYHLGFVPEGDVATKFEESFFPSRWVSIQADEEKLTSETSESGTDDASASGLESSSAESSTAGPTEESTEEPATEEPASDDPVTGDSAAEEPTAEEAAASPEPTADGPLDDGNLSPLMEDTPPEPKWLTALPERLVVDEKLFQLGEQKFNQVCAVCHGFAGFGNGLVAQRADALAASYWVQPTSVHDPRLQQQPIGQIYHTITNGKGKMGGYGTTLNVRERWAVALYVKALQRSQNAQSSDVPLDRLEE